MKAIYKVKVSRCDELILHGSPSGLLRSIGVSNYTVAHLEEMLQYATVVPAVLQVMLVINVSSLLYSSVCLLLCIIWWRHRTSVA